MFILYQFKGGRMSTPRDERTADSSNDYVSVLRRGSRFGAAGWLVGIVVSFVLFRSPSLQPGQGLAGANIDTILVQVPGWRLSAYTYYGGHFVRITPEDLMYGSANMALHVGGVALLAFLLPAITLLVAGYLYTQRQNPETLSDARRYGTGIVGGYAVLMVLGRFLFNYSTTDSYGNQWAITLSFGRTVVFALVYPVVFGAVGGQPAHSSR